MEVTLPFPEVEPVGGREENMVYFGWEAFLLHQEFPKNDVVKVGQSYGVELLESLTGSETIVKTNPAVHFLSVKHLWSHHKFYVSSLHKNCV